VRHLLACRRSGRGWNVRAKATRDPPVCRPAILTQPGAIPVTSPDPPDRVCARPVLHLEEPAATLTRNSLAVHRIFRPNNASQITRHKSCDTCDTSEDLRHTETEYSAAALV
jgi:hypothetical protein